MKTYRVLIAEDEPLSRQQLEHLVLRHDRLELIASVANGSDAIARIDAMKPDAVFLDIRMPGTSGIEVVRRMRHRPYVVFTTAYDEFAVTAFELQALDYLLKPFGPRRFERAVDRLLKHEVTAYDLRIQSGLERTPVEQLFVRDGRRMQRVDVATIVRVEAADDYSCVVTNDGSRLLVNVRMKAMESRLDPTRFVRVHRSTIVSINHIEEVVNVGSGRAELRMQDGSRWAASRSGLERLRAATSGSQPVDL